MFDNKLFKCQTFLKTNFEKVYDNTKSSHKI